MEGHHPSVVQGPLLGSSGSRSGSGTSLLQVVAALVTDDWYKVIAEALRVLEAVVTAAAKAKADGSPPSDAVVATVFDAVNKRLDTVDIDQEIKDCAINAVGKVASSLSQSHPPLTLMREPWQLISCFGDSGALQGKLPALFLLLQRRLENETTRTATLKAITAIACSTHGSVHGDATLAACAMSLFISSHRCCCRADRTRPEYGLVSAAAVLLGRAVSVSAAKQVH